MINLQAVMFLKVTPSGFEPKSSEPESEILSIELWGRLKWYLIFPTLLLKPKKSF